MASRARVLSLAVSAALVSAGARADAAPVPSATPAASAAPASDAATLDTLVATLTSSRPAPERLAAARDVEKLGPEAEPAVVAKLAELRKSPTPGVPAAIEQARKAAGREGDLLEALVAQDGDAPRAAAVVVACARALANAGTTTATRALLRVAADHNGALRPELARLVKKLGERAIPALLETRKDATPAVRAWAYAQLEAMGKRIPADAVQTKDSDVLVDVLRAYAHIGDLDALPVILSFVNADRAKVRDAAREAVVAYGPEAIWKLREAYANVVGHPAPESTPFDAVARELFAAYDRLRLQEVYGLFDQGVRAEKDGKVDEAVAAFDKVLARQPLLDRRAEAAPAYLAHGRKLEESDPAAARADFEKALRLAPEGAFVPQLEAELAYLEGKDLLARGIVDETPFRKALERDPAHAKAREELTQIEEKQADREQKLRAVAGGALVLLLGVVAAILFGGFRSRRGARA